MLVTPIDPTIPRDWQAVLLGYEEHTEALTAIGLKYDKTQATWFSPDQETDDAAEAYIEKVENGIA